MQIIDQIKKNKFTILFDDVDHDGSFRFMGYFLNNNPNVIYKIYVPLIAEKDTDKTYIRISEYFYNKIEDVFKKQLQDYIEKNINNKDFYYEKNEYNQYIFWNKYNLNHFREEYPNYCGGIRLDFSKIHNGIIEFRINNKFCSFDIIKDDFVMIAKKKYNEVQEITPLEVFYNQLQINIALAIEQHKKGIAHKAFSELVKLNNFLEGKKSVRLILDNNEEIKVALTHSTLDANDIVELVGDKFYITTSYNMKPRPEKNIPINRLKCLKYGRTTYEINPNNLVIN